MTVVAIQNGPIRQSASLSIRAFTVKVWVASEDFNKVVSGNQAFRAPLKDLLSAQLY